MRARPFLINGGIVVFLVGLFFAAQGLGWFPFPRSSMMVGNAQWVTNGSVIAVVGLLMVLIGRRLR